MDQHGGINDQIDDVETSPNIKVIAMEWLALEAELVLMLQVRLGVTGQFPGPDDPVLHAPGGAVERWLEFSRQREQAAGDALRMYGRLPPKLLFSYYPAFNPLALQFMAEAIALHETQTG
jgi:hypothetical protein